MKTPIADAHPAASAFASAGLAHRRGIGRLVGDAGGVAQDAFQMPADQHQIYVDGTLAERRDQLGELLVQRPAEVIEGHIRFHILAQNGSATDEQTQAADDLVSALRAYLK